ncbi:MAG TPA: hypothetical protein VE134_08035, partial [Methanomicrobiales archaeon]|nr:hypothetical protein [Methanomicrobiales archaeon]
VSFTNELLAQISPLAPGDFRIVRDRFALCPSETVTHDGILHALEEELGSRNSTAGKRRSDSSMDEALMI